MPTNKARVFLALPDDLYELLTKDAADSRLQVATRATQIIDEHYRRVALQTQRNNKILKGSGLLTARQEATMDFSGGAYAEKSQFDGLSEGAKQA